MPTVVVGRDSERTSIRDFVASIPAGVSALVLEGPAGIGKTTLWLDAIEAAEEKGVRVLRARQVESEAPLSFACLGDLLDPVIEEALEALPLAQRRALSRALVLDDAESFPPDPRAVGVAALNSLRALSARQAIAVAVDDVQWLDAASSAALVFATRRLREEPLGVILARRASQPSALVDELRRALADDRFNEVEVAPLGPDDLHRVVRNQLGMSLPRPVLLEVHRVSGGNPFFALEIQRTLHRTGASIEPGKPLPVPESLHELVHGRLSALPAESREYVLAAAACASPTTHLVEAATGVFRREGLVPALDAQIVELDGTRIRFTHPLLSAGAYEGGDPVRRAEIHARLAELDEEPEARAWHLAASLDAPNAQAADALEKAAMNAVARGALHHAAVLLDRAHEMTPFDQADLSARRTVDAALLHLESGDMHLRFAEERVRVLVETLPDGRERSRALLVLASIRRYVSLHEAVDLFVDVVTQRRPVDPDVLARAHLGIAGCLYMLVARLEESVEHAKLALALSEQLDDEGLVERALVIQLGAEVLLGRPDAAKTSARALELQATMTEGRDGYDLPLGVVVYWIWTDLQQQARDALRDMLRRAEEAGDEQIRPYLLFLRGSVDALLGDLGDALRFARQGLEAADQNFDRDYAAYNLSLEAFVLAQVGSRQETEQAVWRALELAPENGLVRLVTSIARGHLEVALRAPDRVITSLQPTLDFAMRESIVEPAALRFVPDLVEALIELGRHNDALELLDWYEGHARRLDRASALASCARCRGLLAAQTGALDDAIAFHEEALHCHKRAEIPIDRGRTLLALGATQRRSNRRRDARLTLDAAAAIFERIGATVWLERAHEERRRVSGRASAPGGLTPAERRIAELAAIGRTNREIAAVLFLSDRTVEWHLSHVFGKLGIKRRAEVAGALPRDETPVPAESNPRDSPVPGERASS